MAHFLPPSVCALVAFVICSKLLNGSALAEESGSRVVLRSCPTLDRSDLLSLLAARIPDVEFLPDDAERALVPWLAEVCSDGASVASTLTDIRNGATDVRTAPFPRDAGSAGAERLLARLLSAQILAAQDAWTSPPSEPPPPGPTPLEPAPSRTPPVDFVMSLGCATIGGINGRADRTSIALGPTLHLGALIDEIGVLEFEIASLDFWGSADSDATVNALPLAVAGGALFESGPVSLGVLLSVVAERWAPFGQSRRGGWRGGLGLSGRLVVPLAWLLELRLDAGIDFFPESYSVGYDRLGSGNPPDTIREIAIDLANWRWRASLGLQFRFPLL
jgi:hypothetical protein